MATASVTSVPGAPYTWASAGFTWVDARAGKPWKDAAPAVTTLTVTEDVIGVAELARREPKKVVKETLAVTDVARRKIVKKILVTLSISETYVDNISFVLRAFESLTVSESTGRNVRLPFSESFGVVESGDSRNVTLGVTEAIAVSETFGRAVAYRLALQESVGVADAIGKSMRIAKEEALSIYDEYLRRSNAVISDMITDTGDITVEDLMLMVENGHSPGYTGFKPFIPGDYEFQKALFRVVLTSSSEDRPRLGAMGVTVDVPDVFDRGSAAVTDAQAGIYVKFARPFHIVPDITLTLKGGTVVAIPDVISSDEFGFTAVLKNPSTDSHVTGSFTWAAHGY